MNNWRYRYLRYMDFSHRLEVTFAIILTLQLELFLCATLPADWKDRFHPSVLDAEKAANGNWSSMDDIIWDDEADGFQTQARENGLLFADNYWPNNGQCIPYFLHPAFGTDGRLLIKSALRIIERSSQSCLTFKERTNELEYINIAKGKSCRSDIGRIPGRRTEVRLGNKCMTQAGIILHEVLHAPGLFHEQNRPDRDYYVQVFRDHIQYDRYERNYGILPNMSTHGTQYDLESIMHYWPFHFARRDDIPTMIPKTLKPEKMGQKEYLSVLDVAKLRRAYGCVDENNLPVSRAFPLECSMSTTEATTTTTEATTDHYRVNAVSSHVDEPRRSKPRKSGNTGLLCQVSCAAHRICLAGENNRCPRPQKCDCGDWTT